MRSPVRSVSVPLILFFVSCLPIAAQTSPSQSAPNREIPTDPNKDFRVAVSTFQGDGLGPDNEYLRQAIPLLLLQTISALKDHHFDPSERAAYQRSVVKEAIAAQRETIDKLFQSRALILFSSGDPTSALEASTKSINAAVQRLDFLEKLDPATIAVAQDKPIDIVQSKSGAQLVPYPLISAAHTANDLNLGILVWGNVNQVEEYLVVHIDVFDRAIGQTVFHFSKTYAPNNVLESATEVSNQLVRNVLGRDFGTLTLDVKPSSALVYLDGSFYGIGSAAIDYMKTGTHRIEVRAPGYDPKSATVSIAPFQNTKESVSLTAVQRSRVVVSSLPDGADVYLSSEWKGKTPMVLTLPDEDEALVLRLKGYHDYTTTLSKDSPPRIDVRLLPDVFKSQVHITDLRNRVYSSFGAFALSMILPVTFYSLLQDSQFEYATTTSTQEGVRLQNRISVWYYSFFGGAFISSALLTNTIIDISEYLRAIR